VDQEAAAFARRVGAEHDVSRVVPALRDGALTAA
jgi:hypothetical protein